MNKKQLLEAVELVQATHTEEELRRLSVRQFMERGLLLCGSDQPIEDHIIAIASRGGESRYCIWRALAAHHPNRFARWWYKCKHDHSFMLAIPTIMFWVGVVLLGAPVVALVLGSPRFN